jgi:glycerol dehydrogenase-like iron-containing ADH family enzyme
MKKISQQAISLIQQIRGQVVGAGHEAGAQAAPHSVHHPLANGCTTSFKGQEIHI